jgi:hypothetical protein
LSSTGNKSVTSLQGAVIRGLLADVTYSAAKVDEIRLQSAQLLLWIRFMRREFVTRHQRGLFGQRGIFDCGVSANDSLVFISGISVRALSIELHADEHFHCQTFRRTGR